MERPELTPEMMKRIKDAGLDPELMSNEQLAALHTLDLHGNRHWTSQVFGYLAFGCVILGAIRLIALDVYSVSVYAVLALIFFYISYRIQRAIANKMFEKASRAKWEKESTP